MDKWIHKMWYIHTIKYYLAMKRNGDLIHAMTWMNLENIMLTERSRTQNTTWCMISFLGNVQNRQIHRVRKEIIVARGWEEGKTETTESFLRVWIIKHILKLDTVDGYTYLEYTKHH